MAMAQALLGLLEGGPRHGYDLKQAYDERLGHDRPVAYGQVYATLSRLLRDGLVELAEVGPGSGPDRKQYAITDAGVADVAAWLARPESPQPYLQPALYSKMVVALLSGRDAASVVETQRSAHLAAMRDLNRRKTQGDLADQLICDHALLHLDADLRWLQLTEARLDQLAMEVGR